MTGWPRDELNRADPRLQGGRLTVFPLMGHTRNVGDLGGQLSEPTSSAYVGHELSGLMLVPSATQSSANLSPGFNAATMGLAGAAPRTMFAELQFTFGTGTPIYYSLGTWNTRQLFGLRKSNSGSIQLAIYDADVTVNINPLGASSGSVLARLVATHDGGATAVRIRTYDPATGAWANFSGSGSGALNTATAADLALFYSSTVNNADNSPGLSHLGFLGGRAWSESEALAWLHDPGALWRPDAPIIVSSGAAPADVTVAPPAGAIVIAGLAPGVSAAVVAAPTSGAIAVTGLVPAVSAEVVAAPTAGAIVMTGLAPAVSVGVTVAPAAGAIILQGQAPAVAAAVEASPAAGAIQVVGLAPTVAVGVTVAPAARRLAFQGLAPGVSAEVQASPASGGLVVTGLAPVVSLGSGVVVQPGAGRVAVTGLAPAVQAGVTSAAGAGAVRVVGLVPAVSAAVSVAPAAGRLVATGLVPVVHAAVGVAPGPGAILVRGLAPAVSMPGASIEAGAGRLRLVGLAPSVAAGVVVSPGPGVVVVSGLAPIVVLGTRPHSPARTIALRARSRVCTPLAIPRVVIPRRQA